MELITNSSLIYIACGLSSGILIGAVGIGGVILVPLLTFIVGVDIYHSIAASIFSFMISGSVGTIIYLRRDPTLWRQVKLVWIGAVPATLAGSFLLSYFTEEILTLLIAGLTLVSGGKEFFVNKKLPSLDIFPISDKKLIWFASITGLLSSLSGTGGPLVLIPLLLWFSAPVIATVALAQAIQLPISIFATIGNSVNGILDLRVAIPIAFGISIGTFLGSHWIKKVPVNYVKKAIAALLVIVGVAMSCSVVF
jgi:uncharacterized membrane protein YfcA